jgi:hypothetical protein
MHIVRRVSAVKRERTHTDDDDDRHGRRDDDDLRDHVRHGGDHDPHGHDRRGRDPQLQGNWEASKLYPAVKREPIPSLKGNWHSNYARAHDTDCGKESKKNIQLHRDSVSTVTRMRCMPLSIAGKIWREAKSSQEFKGFEFLRNSSFAGSLYITQ